ncbi:MAG TPA: DUF2997 domain-containing protein [Nitrolancea sp.]|nr:DUF2997 domain-containing protein [Nitrolancea sp.]
MPEIAFTIDPATGELELQVTGIAGPACEEVARLARELLGQPGQERNTAEYLLRANIQPRVQPKARQ